MGRLSAAAIIAVSAALSTTPVNAQGSGDGFLFKEPVAKLTLSGGFARPNAGSDIFSFVTNELTVSKNDFNAVSLGADLGLRVAPRLDIVVGAGFAGSAKRSEFRGFTDNNSLPIEQTTRFQRAPLTIGAKAYLTPRGRSFGHYAWAPAHTALFVGGGVGAMWYQFKQQGDFIDFNTNVVFPDTFSSSGFVPTAHALAGLDFALSPRFGATAEGRYTLARANLSEDFSGFDSIDLSGASATVGFYMRF